MPRPSRSGPGVSDPMADLVARAQMGDSDALTQLILQTEQRVYNLAYRILNNRQEAEDMAQEIYLKVWRALPSFRGESKFTTWLHAIATHASLNRLRKLKREPVVLADTEENLERLLARDTEDTESEFEPGEKACIWQQVRRLPVKYALVLTLFYQQQLSYEEITQVLGLPLGTVKAQLNRARLALARSLKETRTP